MFEFVIRSMHFRSSRQRTEKQIGASVARSNSSLRMCPLCICENLPSYIVELPPLRVHTYVLLSTFGLCLLSYIVTGSMVAKPPPPLRLDPLPPYRKCFSRSSSFSTRMLFSYVNGFVLRHGVSPACRLAISEAG
jgi:hypothetical protein